MTNKEIQHILCAVRGVPQSRDTVSYAIQITLEHQAQLTFAHVNDAMFMQNASPTMTSLPTVYKQMRDMSEFTLLVLCDRARRRGVERVDYRVLDGRFLVQIRSLLNELQPDIMVIGKPIATDPANSTIPHHEFNKLIAETEQESHTKVHPVEIRIET